MLATLIVNSAHDNVTPGDGLVTLREAIVAANNDTVTDLGLAGFGADTILFATNITPQAGDDFAIPRTIFMAHGEFEITESLTIEGPGQELLTINALQTSRIFNFTSTTGDNRLAGLTLTGGLTQGDNATPPINFPPYIVDHTFSGGAVRMRGDSLTIEESTITGNITAGNNAYGGGVFARELTLIDSTVMGNSTEGTSAHGGGIAVPFSNLTVTNSTISGNSSGGNGGGVFAVRSSVTLTDSTVSGNSGRGIFTEEGDVAIFGSTVSGNSNGGIATVEGDITLTNSTVSGHTITADFTRGAGIFSTGDVTLINSAVTGNSTAGFQGPGGGIFSERDVTLTNSTVSFNSTTGDYAEGGGIAVKGLIEITNSIVRGNSTAGNNSPGGGIAVRYSGVAPANPDNTITRSTVRDNSTAGDDSEGGGVAIDTFKSLTVIDSTISGNNTAGEQSRGGGISGGTTLIGSTISGNSTTGRYSSGGGIFGLHGSTSSTVTKNHANYFNSSGGGVVARNKPGTTEVSIRNSIIAGNTQGTDSHVDDIDPGAAALSINSSLIEETGLTFNGVWNIFGVPANLGPLAYNGGPTETHALLVGSPAIDAGNANPTGFDQRGEPFVRVFDDPGTAGTGIDIGAYERQPFSPVVDTTSDENDGDYSSGNLSLREAVDIAKGSVGDTTITFDAVVFATPQTILLSLGEIDISEEVNIQGPGQGLLTIDAQQQSRIFNITATTGDFTLAGLTLTGGKTTSNGTLFRGGAVRSNSTGSLTIDQSTITGNSTVGSNAGGGGISSNGPVMLTDSTVSENSTGGSSAGGGAIFSLGSGGVTLTNSTLSGNSTAAFAASGGAIFSNSGPVALIQSTLSGNSTSGGSAYGGGIFSGGPVTLSSSTIAANHTDHATATGGGIWNSNDPIVIANSIVAGNTAGGGMNDIRPGTGSLNIDFSLIEDIAGLAITGSNNITGMSANLEPLSSNGGLTRTHALLPGSLAIHAGDPSILLDPAEFDQRGAPFDRVSGAAIDIGAYEQQTVAGLNLVVDTIVDENDGDYSAGDLSLREAVGLASGSTGSDTITFDAVVFATPQTILLSLGEIAISEAVTIEGPGQELLTIDAQQQSRIFNITATAGDFTLAGMTLTDGRTIGDNAFLGTTFSGGAVRSLTTGNLTIDQSTVSGNSTAGFAGGGGIFSSADVTLTGSTVSGNITTGIGADGGGILSSGDVTLTTSTVSGNSTAGYIAAGGGIYSFGDVTLTTSTVSENSTAGSGGVYGGSGGGGIRSLGTVTLTSSTVSENSTAGNNNARGGGIFSSGDVTLANSTVSGNSTTGTFAHGGGILSFGDFTLTNSTITDNHAYDSNATGGGIWNDNDTIDITNSIVTGNMAGGGMNDINPGTGPLTVDFSLIGDVTGLTIVGSGNNIDSATIDLQVAIDFSAFGDFESTDQFDLSYTIDGGGLQPLFTNTVNEAGGQSYTLEDGTIVMRNDPLLVNGTTLSNVFQTLTATIPGVPSGASVEIVLVASANGGGETFVFRNIVVTELDSGSLVAQALAIGSDFNFSFTQDDPDYSISEDMFGIRSRTIPGNPGLPGVVADDSVSNPPDSDGIIRSTDTADFFGVADTVNGTGNDTNIARWAFLAPTTPGPLLGPLADNGGPIQTHALLPGSPAINAGDPAAVSGAGNVPLNDQRGEGFDRVSGTAIDMGAFEVQELPVNPGDFNDDLVVDSADYTVWRDNLGAADESSIANHGDGQNGVDQADYDLWSQNYGAVYLASPASVEVASASVQPLTLGPTTFEPGLMESGELTKEGPLDAAYASLESPGRNRSLTGHRMFTSVPRSAVSDNDLLLIATRPAAIKGESPEWFSDEQHEPSDQDETTEESLTLAFASL